MSAKSGFSPHPSSCAEIMINVETIHQHFPAFMLNLKVMLCQFRHPSSKTSTLIILIVINHFVAAWAVTNFSPLKETAMSPNTKQSCPQSLVSSCNTIYLTTLQHEVSKINGPWLVALKLTQNSWYCVIGRVTTKYENRGCARIESAVTFGVRFPTYKLPSYELVWLRADLCWCIPSWSKEPKYSVRPKDTLTSRNVSGQEKFLIATVDWLKSYPRRPPLVPQMRISSHYLRVGLPYTAEN
jgi:hypothetical protein